jgi:hypothetical protein
MQAAPRPIYLLGRTDQEVTAMSAAVRASAALDESRVEQFAERLFGTYTESIVTLMIDLADRTGLLAALATGSGTSEGLAARAGLQERYVRECLGALVTAGIVEYDAREHRYVLPREHAACLTGEGSSNVAPMARVTALLAGQVGGVARADLT